MKNIILVLLLLVGVPALEQDYKVEDNSYVQITKAQTLLNINNRQFNMEQYIKLFIVIGLGLLTLSSVYFFLQSAKNHLHKRGTELPEVVILGGWTLFVFFMFINSLFIEIPQ